MCSSDLLEGSYVLLVCGVGSIRLREEGLELERRQLGIDAGSVLDRLSPNTETKSRQCLCFVVCRRRAIDNEGRARVTTKRFL